MMLKLSSERKKESNWLLIASKKRAQHFESYFAEGGIDIQPEVENPHLFNYSLPSNEIPVNEESPNKEELIKNINSPKNNKCKDIQQTKFMQSN